MKSAIAISTADAKFSALALRGDLQQIVRSLVDLGFDGVELSLKDPRSVELPSFKRLLSSVGLAVPAIGTGRVFSDEGLSFSDPGPETRSRAVQRVKDLIEMAAELKSQVIIGMVRGRRDGRMSYEEAVKWVEDALAQCASYARSRGVTLALEPINRYETDLLNSVAECLPLARAFADEGVGLLVDTFHMNIEEPDILQSTRSARGLITHIHFADSNRWAPGCGHIDFSAIVKVLHEIGYSGFVSAEILPKPNPEEAARLAAAAMNSLIR